MKKLITLLALTLFTTLAHAQNVIYLVGMNANGQPVINTIPIPQVVNDGLYASLLSKPANMTLTTIGTSGASSYNSATNVLNIPNYLSPNVYTAGTNMSLVSGAFNNTAPDQTVSLTAGQGETITGTYPNFTIAKTKRQETYSGSTNSSGIYAVTFGTAYSAAPNIQMNMIGGTNKTTALTTVTTTGFSIYVQLRADVLGLLPSYSNVNAQPVDVLVTEK